MTMGDKIKRRREKAGMTQKDLADASGLTQSSVSYYESGERTPSLKTLAALAKALGTKAEALVRE